MTAARDMTVMTSPEVAGAIEAGADTVLVSLGSIEQHGPGLPLNVDVLHGRETCLRAADGLSHVVVGPDVPFGVAPLHMGFAGTISLRQATLAAVITDVAQSLAATGFRLVYFWIAHAQSLPALLGVLDDVNGTLRGARACGPSDFAAYAAATWSMMGEEEGVSAGVAGSHAGEIEASMTAAIAPQLVRRHALAAGNTDPSPSVGEHAERDGMASVAPNGVLGDQRAADAVRGTRYLDRLAAWLREDIARQRAAAGLEARR